MGRRNGSEEMNQHRLQATEGRRHFCSADLCSLIEVSPGAGTASERKLPDRLRTLRGEKSSSHADNVFIKYIL